MRSKLFVPAVRPELFAKALASVADAVCYDLEDAVTEDRKAEAREILRLHLQKSVPSSPAPLEIVRVNSPTSVHFLPDLEAVVGPRLHALAIPKVETPEEVVFVEEQLKCLRTDAVETSAILLLPTIETPRGLRNASAIAAASSRIAGLQVGFADLLEPLGIAWKNATARAYVQCTLRFAAAECQVPCFDSAYADFRDMEGFRVQAAQARALGFAGTSCIHPSQIVPANQIFTPNEAEIAAARRIVDAMDSARRSGSGLPVLDGRMVDAPFERAARLLLARI